MNAHPPSSSIFVRSAPRLPRIAGDGLGVVHSCGAAARGLPDAAVATRLSLPEELDHILPALVRPDELDLEPANDNFRDSDTLVTRRVSDEIPLLIVYAVLRPGYNAWIAQTCLTEELDEAILHERALTNLAKAPISEAVRQVVESRSMRVLQELGGFDAARVLLLPECLRQDETLAALLFDRGTLGLAPAPQDGNWRSLGRLVRRRRNSRSLFGSVIAVHSGGLAVA